MKFIFKDEVGIMVDDSIARRNSKFINDALEMNPVCAANPVCEIDMPHSRAATMRVVTFWENHADAYVMKKKPIDDADELMVQRYAVFGATLKRLNESLMVATFLDSEVAIDAICTALGPMIVDIDLPIVLTPPVELTLVSPPDLPVILIEPWRQFDEMRKAVKAKDWTEVTALASQRRGVAEWWDGLLPKKCEISLPALQALDEASPMPCDRHTIEALLTRLTQEETKKWIIEKAHTIMAAELQRITTMEPCYGTFKKMLQLGPSAMATVVEGPRFDPCTITLEQLIELDSIKIVTSKEARDAVDTLCGKNQPARADIMTWLAPVVATEHLHAIVSHPETARLFCALFPGYGVSASSHLSPHEQLVIWRVIIETGEGNANVLLSEILLWRLLNQVPESERETFGRSVVDLAISLGADPNKLDGNGDCALQRVLDSTFNVFRRPDYERLRVLRGVVTRLLQKTDVVPAKGAFENHPALPEGGRKCLKRHRCKQQMQHAEIPVDLTSTLEPYLPVSKRAKYSKWGV